jgi:2-polyprenyl-3-methyl-5-hydroxy-6-metoxy-1,4-benzoquinol methylase
MGTSNFEKSIKFKDYWNSTNSFWNFVSYYYQIKEICYTNPKNILEIGVGGKLISSHLKNAGFAVKTLDINDDFNPDYVGDLRQDLPFKSNSFDTVCTFEVLEHLEFKYFEKVLVELKRVSKKYVVISLPIKKNVLFFHFRSFGKYLSFYLKVPFIFDFFCKKCKSHFWEINFEISLKEIKSVLGNHFIIVRSYRSNFNPYHYFFVLEKK